MTTTLSILSLNQGKIYDPPRYEGELGLRRMTELEYLIEAGALEEVPDAPSRFDAYWLNRALLKIVGLFGGRARRPLGYSRGPGIQRASFNT